MRGVRARALLQWVWKGIPTHIDQRSAFGPEHLKLILLDQHGFNCHRAQAAGQVANISSLRSDFKGHPYGPCCRWMRHTQSAHTRCKISLPYLYNDVLVHAELERRLINRSPHASNQEVAIVASLCIDLALCKRRTVVLQKRIKRGSRQYNSALVFR